MCGMGEDEASRTDNVDHVEPAVPINIRNESLEGISLTLNLEKGKNTTFCKYKRIFNKPFLIIKKKDYIAYFSTCI